MQTVCRFDTTRLFTSCANLACQPMPQQRMMFCNNLPPDTSKAVDSDIDRHGWLYVCWGDKCCYSRREINELPMIWMKSGSNFEVSRQFTAAHFFVRKFRQWRGQWQWESLSILARVPDCTCFYRVRYSPHLYIKGRRVRGNISLCSLQKYQE